MARDPDYGFLDDIEKRLKGIEKAIREGAQSITAALKPAPPERRTLDPMLIAVYGRSAKMPVNVPVPKLLDTEKILLSVMPRLANGHIDTSVAISWSSDSADIGIQVGTDPFPFTDPQFPEDGEQQIPGDRNCFALTPGLTGSGNVTASGTGYDSAIFGPIVYEPGQPRSLNASIGSPVSDL
jgi:hypothetical protein